MALRSQDVQSTKGPDLFRQPPAFLIIERKWRSSPFKAAASKVLEGVRVIRIKAHFVGLIVRFACLFNNRMIVERLDALKRALRENIRRYSAADYLAARNFVEAVAAEAQRPVVPRAKETVDKVAGN